MKVYAVKCKSWNGEYTETEVEVLFLNKADASAYVEDAQLTFPNKGPYSREYSVVEMEVF
jgi:hypothetical protein